MPGPTKKHNKKHNRKSRKGKDSTPYARPASPQAPTEPPADAQADSGVIPAVLCFGERPTYASVSAAAIVKMFTAVVRALPHSFLYKGTWEGRTRDWRCLLKASGVDVDFDPESPRFIGTVPIESWDLQPLHTVECISGFEDAPRDLFIDTSRVLDTFGANFFWLGCVEKDPAFVAARTQINKDIDTSCRDPMAIFKKYLPASSSS